MYIFCNRISNIFLSFHLTLGGSEELAQTRGGKEMPETLNGRKRINEYLKAEKISYSQLATLYGMNKQDVADYLTGRKQTPAATRFIIALIKAFGLSYEGK